MASELTRGKLVRDIGGTFVTSVLTIPISLGTGIITARALQPTQRGVYTSATTIAAVGLMIGSLGIAKAMTVELVSEDSDRRRINRTGLGLNALNAIFVAVAMVLVALAAGHTLFPGLPLSVLLLAAPIALFTQMRGHVDGVLRGEHRNHTINIVSLAQSLSFFVAILIVALCFGLTAQSGVALRSAAIAFALVLGVSFIGWRDVGMPPTLDRAMAVRLMRWSVPYSVIGTAQGLNYKLDVLLVQGLSGSRQAGYYSITSALVEMIWYLPLAVGIVIFPRSATKRHEDAGAETAALMRWTFVATATTAIVLLIVVSPVIRVLFGSAYLPAVAPTRLVMIGVLTNTWYLVLGSYLIGRGHLSYLAVITAVGMVLNVILNVLLIPALGIEGAAVASSVSYTATGILVLLRFLRATPYSLRAVTVPTAAEISGRLAWLRSKRSKRTGR